MTAQQPRQCLPSPAQHAITIHRLRRIFRTSRNVPACRRKHRRNRPLVSPQHLQHNAFADLAHKKLAATSLSLPSRTFVPFVVQALVFPREPLLYNYESPPHFVHHLGEVYGEQRLLRIDDHIRARTRGHAAKPHRLAQPPLHAIALHRAAECAAHGKSNADPGRRTSRSFRPHQIKRRQGRGKMPSPQLVHALEVGVPQQPRVARKAGVAGSRFARADPWVRFSLFRLAGHTGSHSDSNFQIACISAGARANIRATGLFAETWFHRDPLAPLGATAGNYLLAALGLHAHAKSVCLRSLAPVGLECTLGHEK
jgi:hypothetical protein